MKRLLLFVVLFFLAESSSAQLNVWRWQNPLPEGNYLNAVQMMSLNTIYICGAGATFLRSSDGGQTWDIQGNIFKSKASFNALNFLNQNYGMCCGDSGRIIKTTDGGTTWQLLKSNTIGKLNSIVIVDQNIAVAITYGGGILRTSDAGATWTPLPIEGSQQLFSVKMLNPNFLTITGFGGTLLISTDQGLSWHPKATNVGNSFFGSNFTDNNNGTLIGEYGYITHTSDGGASWIKQQLVAGLSVTASLNVVDGKDPNILAIAGDYGTLLFTTNGGASWQQSFIGTADPVKGLSFFDKLNAIAVGRNGMVLETNDGGTTWFFLPHKAYTDLLYSAAFPKGDTSLGLAVGELGTILRTSNGGKIWSIDSSGTNKTFRGVCFIDSISAIAVGDNGIIIKSTDAGLTWVSQLSATTQNLYSVSFSTPTDGLAVGDNNTVLRTYSGGQFWTREFAPLGDTDFFKSVTYPDVNHAYMSGYHGYYSSTNGGVDWKYHTYDDAKFPSYVFHAISFADSLHGSMIYSYGPDGSTVVFWFAKFTSNGGVSWDSVATPDNVALNGVQCIARGHTTIVGNAGYISHTTDGGITLNIQQSNTLNNLYGVAFGNLSAGNAVGNRGNIVRITSDDKLGVHATTVSGSPKPILDPCYPNPSSSSATISYYLPSGGLTAIKIYTIDGKKIATLVNSYMQQGEQKANCDVSKLASGSYLIRLDFGGVSVSQRLTVMR